MRSDKRGRGTSPVEVTSISAHGLSLRLGARDLFVSFTDFPWFKDASVSDVFRVVLEGPDHLRWPSLDIDLHVDSILHPERYPLRFAPNAKFVRDARLKSKLRTRPI
ncbi:MAG: DUF2442 domain-containing protein [Candidatus Hydrogenedentales bacterium]